MQRISEKFVDELGDSLYLIAASPIQLLFPSVNRK